MDLSLSPEDRAFREEVRDFFRTSVPAAVRQKVENGIHPGRAAMVDWQRALDDRGWSVPNWPAAHGGTGWSAIRRLIFQEEMFLAHAPYPPPFGPTMVGPVIIARVKMPLSATSRCEVLALGVWNSLAASCSVSARSTVKVLSCLGPTTRASRRSCSRLELSLR